MIILGLLSFFQMTFIPGFLLLKYKKPKWPPLDTLVCGFGLSLLINYLLVFTLTTVGLYKPLTFYIILLVEGILLLYYWTSLGKAARCVNLDLKQWRLSFKRFTKSHTLGYTLLYLISIAVILWYVFLFVYFMGDVFEHWDPVVGWNRFAVDWAANKFPIDTFRYPQLIPSNWSISYVLMQNIDVQCFAKSIMGLFPIAILLLFLESGTREKKPVYLFGLILFGASIGYIYDPSYIVSGYVDIAISFFAFLSFHLMNKRKDMWAVVFASAAAIAKQAGLFFLVFILVWAFIRMIINRDSILLKRRISKILMMILAVSFITAPWYIIKEIDIRNGKDKSEIDVAQKANPSSNVLERFTNGIQNLTDSRYPKLRFFFYGLLILALLGLFHKESWRVTLLISIPFFLMWGFLFSYDSRNLAPAIPFIAYSASFGAVFLITKLPDPEKLKNFKIPIAPLIVLVLAVVTIANFTVFKKESLIDRQIHKQMKIGDTELNELLYDYNAKVGITGKIVTTYQYLGYLPGLKRFYVYKPGRITPGFLDSLETQGGEEIHYLLMPIVPRSETKVYPRLSEKLKSNEYRIIFKCRGYHFIKVR